MEATTVHTAAQITGWSVRMLRYLEAAGLVSPPRSSGGYRLYSERQIAHLRELRQLMADHDLKPADLQVALRLRSEPALRRAVDGWLDSALEPATDTIPITAAASSPTGNQSNHDAPVSDPTTSWLRFEQDKHSRALTPTPHPTHLKEHV